MKKNPFVLSLSKHERPYCLRQADGTTSHSTRPSKYNGQVAGYQSERFGGLLKKPTRGFTLLEMLVVLVVASIMLSVATLSLMPSAQSVLRDESKRLAFLMENGAMASQAGGQPLAWSGTGNSYRFWLRTKEGEWVRIERDNLLHPRNLPDTVRIGAVSFNGRSIEPGSLVVLSPELSAKEFRVSLLSSDLISDVVGNGLGKVEVVAGKVQ
jgi:general secretion pathway protein H